MALCGPHLTTLARLQVPQLSKPHQLAMLLKCIFLSPQTCLVIQGSGALVDAYPSTQWLVVTELVRSLSRRGGTPESSHPGTRGEVQSPVGHPGTPF